MSFLYGLLLRYLRDESPNIRVASLEAIANCVFGPLGTRFAY